MLDLKIVTRPHVLSSFRLENEVACGPPEKGVQVADVGMVRPLQQFLKRELGDVFRIGRSIAEHTADRRCQPTRLLLVKASDV